MSTTMAPAGMAEAVTALTTDQAAVTYAGAVEARRQLAGALRQAALALAVEHGPALRAAVAAEADAHAALLAQVETRPDLYAGKRRSRTVAGVKFGWALGKPAIAMADEADTIRRIEATVPEEQAALLINVTKKVAKAAVLDLTAGDLRRLRIVQVPGEDAPFARPVADDTDKLVAALLAEASQEGQA